MVKMFFFSWITPKILTFEYSAKNNTYSEVNFICVYQVWSKLIEKCPSKIQYGRHEMYFFCHFNIRPRWFPAHHRDRLVSIYVFKHLDNAREITAVWCGNFKKLNFVAVILDFWRPSWIDNGYLISLYSIYGNKQSFVPILLLLLK